MISPVNLEILAEELRVYDVVQGAWEQEHNGFEANAKHVLTHLAKDMVRKDFTDVDLVISAIAPDSVQYALRLCRWTGLRTAELVEVTKFDEEVRNVAEEGLGKLPWGFASFAGAVGLLAQNLHDYDHRKTYDDALKETRFTMRSASRLLINSANIQAHQYEFSLMKSFSTRLTELRTRFDIPEPE